MNSVKFGSVYVPIIAEYELTGQPAQTPTNAILQLVRNDFRDIEVFQQGVVIGYSESYATDDIPNWQTVSYIQGGRTGLHDNSELVVSTRETIPSPGDPPTRWVSCIIVRQDGETTTQLYASAEIDYAHRLSSSSNRNYFEWKALYAIKYTYPDASSEWGKQAGYMIGLVTFSVTEYVATGNTNENYNLATTAMWLPIPYINQQRTLELYYDGEPTPDPDEPFDPSDQDPYIIPPGGRDDTSDLIDIPADPPIGVTSVGFINVYKPGVGALQGLGDILFPNVASATDIVDAVIKLCETFANSNLINYVIDCHVIPVTPVTGNNSNIKVGFRDTGISVPVVTSDYANVSCGSLNLAEWFHGFQDYQATRSKLYLPFIGFTDMKPEYWQAGIIYVDYKFNIIDGSFMAYVRSNSSKSNLAGSIIAQFAGNACMHFPITGVNYAQMVSGIVGAGIAAASSGGATAALGSALSAANTIAQGGDTQQSNGYNSTAAILGVRTPYLIIERAVPSYSSGYKHDKGYPANIYASLANVSGYTEIEDIDLSGIPLTDTELTELRDLLKTGVYL